MTMISDRYSCLDVVERNRCTSTKVAYYANCSALQQHAALSFADILRSVDHLSRT